MARDIVCFAIIFIIRLNINVFKINNIILEVSHGFCYHKIIATQFYSVFPFSKSGNGNVQHIFHEKRVTSLFKTHNMICFTILHVRHHKLFACQHLVEYTV
ncbi:hypothetical protein MT325_m316R [Paramecium bursaria chlorella virus MT325]|uniref:Uncharacterized protein m316R n=1 Tax=Paramecium bursaria Chlorella virus MT325 TaxID=346932 RepID=A7IU46_PBCVM|nr:hypothetical protein MT325_m316R [Paramecium bursaria chlorella virus MT325]